jgi:uncharacterized membrane protein
MDHEDKSKVRIDHIISFSDAIFAFSITFMALSIQFPINQSEILTQKEIISKILDLQPQFETYAISFFIVGIYWISYHSLFNYITKSHSITTWLNLLFLFFITLISFTTSLQINYGYYPIIFIIYSIVLTITGALLSLIWINAKNSNHIDESMHETKKTGVLLDSMIPPIVFALSIPISFISIDIAQYFWLIIIPSKIIIRKKYHKNLK